MPGTQTAVDFDGLAGTPPTGYGQFTGPVIASAGTISPTANVHHVSGAAAIATINLPWPNFQGELILISDGIFTWNATGNIQTAGTSTATGKAMGFIYEPVAAKWIPRNLA
jgi:hypothetical protein